MDNSSGQNSNNGSIDSDDIRQSMGEMGFEVAKEAKEKKDKSSWVKTIGMRTLRMRRSTDSRSSKLSLPSFSSLDRQSKKKSKMEEGRHKGDSGSATNSSSTAIYDNLQNKSFASTSNNKNGPSFAMNNQEGKYNSNGIAIDERTTAGAKSEEIPGEKSDKQDPARFLGEGLMFKGKLIGVLEVSSARGDRICQEALSELKMAVKAAGEHKQKVTVHVALDGLRIRDEKTTDCLYHHQVHKISFIAQDLTDSRAFGYIFGSPDTGHRFFGIKTEKSASQVVIAMRDLFQVVFDLKKKEIERAKQQLEMQQKFLATRAPEAIPQPKPEPKFSIAETYIEGACASGTSTTSATNSRTAPEVDLLNLEVELTSLQEGLDSIHNNLQESIPFRGSTTSISSDPLNPMPKRTSVSSANTNNTTPIPSAFNSNVADPFGDSFDPFSEPITTQQHFNTSKGSGNFQSSISCSNSALSSPFTHDPFSQVDPFPGPKFQLDSDFLNSDPFDSPSGPFSFGFGSSDVPPAKSADSAEMKSNGIKRSNAIKKKSISNSSDATPARRGDDWTASFDDEFVPESDTKTDGKPHFDIFKDLDPLAVPSLQHSPAATAKLQKTPVTPSSRLTTVQSSVLDKLTNKPTNSSMSNSFSTNFNPADSESSESTLKLASADARSISPPNYSPPPPPKLSSSDVPKSPLPTILPPLSPASARLKKKSNILKQMTISESHSSPKTLPASVSASKFAKQISTDSPLKEVSKLSPPPRPPHQQSTAGSVSSSSKSGALPSAVPRPVSGSSDRTKRNLVPFVSVVGLPPEPPPRPLASTLSSTATSGALTSPPPPLPPKKQSLASSLSTPSNAKLFSSTQSSSDIIKYGQTSFKPSITETNDLPLPFPARKTHGGGGGGGGSSISGALSEGGRYSVPEPAKSKVDSSAIRSCGSGSSGNRLTMEQALKQVASMSLGDLANNLKLPVERLSHFTIQQLAEKLTEMELKSAESREIGGECSSFKSHFGFDDDFSTASAPGKLVVEHSQSSQGVDRYAVFRELDLQDASVFSILNNPGSFDKLNSDEELSKTLEKALGSRESSSERTLQADDFTEQSHIKNVSCATMIANTMDDVTDINLSDDQDNGKFPFDDDEFKLETDKNEWATFESNFEDQFATTALVKAEDNDSPWESDEGEKEKTPAKPTQEDQFDFQPFEKPAELPNSGLVASHHDSSARKTTTEKDGFRSTVRTPEEPKLQSPFQRQSSGSSRHSERSSGNNGPSGGKLSDYSDPGRPDSGRRRDRKDSREEYERWEMSSRGESGRFREKDSMRSDSRNSYSSMGRRYHGGDSDEEYFPPPSHSSRRSRDKSGGYYRCKSSRDFDRELDPDDEDDMSHHSNYSGRSGSRRHRRHAQKYYPQPYSRSGRRGGDRERNFSPDRFSNHETDESYEEDYPTGNSYGRKREREYLSRERDYYERQHRPRPTSGGGSFKRYSRDSPRHSENYSSRRDRRGRYSRDEDFEDSRDYSDYSGEEDHGHRGSHGYGSHRRYRGRRNYKQENRESREYRGGHYYTNSPSWDSESCPDAEKDVGDSGGSRVGRTKGQTSSRDGYHSHHQRSSAPHGHHEDSPPHYSSNRAGHRGDHAGRSHHPGEMGDGSAAAADSPAVCKSEGKRRCSANGVDVEVDGVENNSEMLENAESFRADGGLNGNEESQSQSPFDDNFVQRSEVVSTELCCAASSSSVVVDSNMVELEPVAKSRDIDVEELNSELLLKGLAAADEDAGGSVGKKTVLDGEEFATAQQQLESTDTFSPSFVTEPKSFSYSGRRLESIKSEEEKSNDDSHSNSAGDQLAHMKKSDSFNIFKQRSEDPFADDFFQ